jgi:hypothetical protein
MRNGIGKGEGWHRICETELGKAKGGIAYAKRDWEKRRAASHMRNRIGKSQGCHGIFEIDLGIPMAAIAFLIGLKALKCYQRKHSSSQK